MGHQLNFEDAARIPASGDNVAIATRRLEAGTAISHEGRVMELPHTVMEGHRFVLQPIAAGEPLLSWGLPFGHATRLLNPGEYVCNEKILRVLKEREIDFEVPGEENFTDHLEPYHLRAEEFQAGRQVERYVAQGTFNGLARPGSRGVGTRNFIVILATTSRTAGLAKAVERRCQSLLANAPGVDGIVAVTHTEGGGARQPNNLDFVLRTLAGFMVHPNVGAIVALDLGHEPYTNDTLREYMAAHGYPLRDVPHAFHRVQGAFEAELAAVEDQVKAWLPEVNSYARSPQPLANLKLALQCGGSDAFSGVSGNALAGWVAKELIRNGGSANLAETDELIGAEPYVLNNVRDLATAQSFLEKIEQFKQRAANHGTSAEGNPSGGNNYRGLYNIALKSIGAARKRDPEVRLDSVIDYSQPMTEGGYYFMDSPGNDLESIAGQVASGSNLILFITGNGSITNFPFVPTLKFVTTTGRFDLLANEMDVNAGRYNDGMPMDALGAETFELARSVAGGQRSKGEQAGHSQVQLWRDWPQTSPANVESILALPKPNETPLAVKPGNPARLSFRALNGPSGPAADQVGLIMPTSLCSGQVAKLIAERLNDKGVGNGVISRFVGLAHTEGCGSRGSEQLYLQTLLGHLRHRAVRRAVLLEHGCEYAHNDAIRHYLIAKGENAARYGWASIQMDGGLEKVAAKVEKLFGEAAQGDPASLNIAGDGTHLRLGLTCEGPLDDAAAKALALLTQGIVAAGGTVVVPANAGLLETPAFTSALLADPAKVSTSLAYGQHAERVGLHVMDAPTEDAVETLTGLGATGVEIMLAHVARSPLQAHPMIPLIQVSSSESLQKRLGNDLDLAMSPNGSAEDSCAALLELIARVASREFTPALYGRGMADFQLTRGVLGMSM